MTTPPGFKRRTLVKALAAGSLIPLLGSNLIGCSDGSDNSFTIDSVPADFNHGVASGDPLTDRVIDYVGGEADLVAQVLHARAASAGPGAHRHLPRCGARQWRIAGPVPWHGRRRWADPGQIRLGRPQGRCRRSGRVAAGSRI